MENGKVRPIQSELKTPGMVTNEFISSKSQKRKFFIHNYEVVKPSTSLHFISEFNRDGRDNTFEVEYFEDLYLIDDSTPVARKDIANLSPGSVLAVRCEGAKEFRNHYIVMDGTEHYTIMSNSPFLDNMAKENPDMDLYFVLSDKNQQLFHEFHGITMKNGEVTFPKQ